MKKLLFLLLTFVLFTPVFACYTDDGHWIVSNKEYLHQKDDIYGTQLSRIYRMKSSYFLMDIWNKYDFNHNFDKDYQLSIWQKYQTIISTILPKIKDKDIKGILTFLQSRLQYTIDENLYERTDMKCTQEQIKKAEEKHQLRYQGF